MGVSAQKRNCLLGVPRYEQLVGLPIMTAQIKHSVSLVIYICKRFLTAEAAAYDKTRPRKKIPHYEIQRWT
jgi:hypothetical protein